MSVAVLAAFAASWLVGSIGFAISGFDRDDVSDATFTITVMLWPAVVVLAFVALAIDAARRKR